MLKKNNAASAVLAALFLSAILLTASESASQPARAQTNNTGGPFTTSANFKDQIVKGGNHVLDQITKGGAGFLNATAANLPNVRANFGSTYQDIIKDDKAGAGTQLKQLYVNFVNDSELAYGLGQELNQIAQNNTAHIDGHTKQILSAIGTDLKDIALRSNSTSTGTGANNSTNSK
jgi:hypothetical protein